MDVGFLVVAVLVGAVGLEAELVGAAAADADPLFECPIRDLDDVFAVGLVLDVDSDVAALTRPSVEPLPEIRVDVKALRPRVERQRDCRE